MGLIQEHLKVEDLLSWGMSPTSSNSLQFNHLSIHKLKLNYIDAVVI